MRGGSGAREARGQGGEPTEEYIRQEEYREERMDERTGVDQAA